MSGSRDRGLRAFLPDLALVAAALGAAAWTAGPARGLALAAAALALCVGLARALLPSRTGPSWKARLRSRGALVALGLLSIAAVAAVEVQRLRSRPLRLPFEPPRPEQAPAGMQGCLEKPEVQDYLRSLHGELIEAWTYPESTPPDQEVVLRFTLHPNGEISDPELQSSTRPGLGQTGLQALARAAPFQPLPEPARCLSGMRLQAQLSNPSAPAP